MTRLAMSTFEHRAGDAAAWGSGFPGLKPGAWHSSHTPRKSIASSRRDIQDRCNCFATPRWVSGFRKVFRDMSRPKGGPRTGGLITRINDHLSFWARTVRCSRKDAGVERNVVERTVIMGVISCRYQWLRPMESRNLARTLARQAPDQMAFGFWKKSPWRGQVPEYFLRAKCGHVLDAR